MRILVVTFGLFSLSLGMRAARLPEGDTNPYIKLTQIAKHGTLRVSIKNISRKPVLAYVVAMENGDQSATHHDFFTGRDAFAPGKTVELVFALSSSSAPPKVFVDYVRLSDNSAWGNPVTEDGKTVAAGFLKEASSQNTDQ